MFSILASDSNEMHLFRAKSREQKIVDYLIGAGLCSNLPVNDTSFYYLAGACSSASWPTNLCRVKPTFDVDNQQPNSCDSHKVTSSEIVYQNTELSAIQQQGPVEDSDSLEKIFKPKPSLPFPLFQETFRRWKSSMDMQLRFRRLRRLRASIVLQTLDEFPAFLSDFRVQLQDYGSLGFFELLHEFTKVYFAGACIHFNSTSRTSAWDVKSRLHQSTGEQQVLVDTVVQHAISKLSLASKYVGFSVAVQYDLAAYSCLLEVFAFKFSITKFTSA